VFGEGTPITDPMQALELAYASDETDEFVLPRVVVDGSGEPTGAVEDGDAIIFFNFRADRVRQITRAFAEEDFPYFDRGPLRPRVEIVTMTQYDEDFPLDCAFPPQEMGNLLADVLDQHGRTSFRTA